MMVRFGLVTDTHITDRRPRNRVDENFGAVALGKFETVVEYCKSRGCVALLHAGDVFDSHRVAPSLVIRMIEALRGLPMVTVPGQHDMLGHNIESCHQASSLGLLEKAGVALILDGGAHTDIEGVRIYGYGFGETATEAFLRGASRVSDRVDFAVALVHAEVDCRRVEKVVVRDVDLVSYGDQHEGWPTVYRDPRGVAHVNTGCLLRKTSAERDFVPRFGILSVDTDTGEFDVKFVKLRVAPPEDVFDVRRIEREISETASAWAAAIASRAAAPTATAADIVADAKAAGGFSDRAEELLRAALPS